MRLDVWRYVSFRDIAEQFLGHIQNPHSQVVLLIPLAFYDQPEPRNHRLKAQNTIREISAGLWCQVAPSKLFPQL
jgi:hypothetical protein